MNNIKVQRKAKVIVTFVGLPTYDDFFRGDFIPVNFIDEQGNVISGSLFANHINRLPMLKVGNTVELVYEVGTHYIKSIDGERWN